MRLTTLLCLFFISFNVLAGAVGGGYSTVKRFYPINKTTVGIILDVPHINPASCVQPAYYALTRDAESPYEFDLTFKTLLAAKASGQKVGVFIHDDKCSGNFPLIWNAYIQ